MIRKLRVKLKYSCAGIRSEKKKFITQNLSQKRLSETGNVGVTADQLGLQRLQPVCVAGAAPFFSRVKQPHEEIFSSNGEVSLVPAFCGFIVL